MLSRHGDCFEVSTLQRRVPDLGKNVDPAAFASFMRQKGHTVTMTRLAVPRGMAQEVKVPERDLSLVFVTPELCAQSPQR